MKPRRRPSAAGAAREQRTFIVAAGLEHDPGKRKPFSETTTLNQK
jgi:hypothetical protein